MARQGRKDPMYRPARKARQARERRRRHALGIFIRRQGRPEKICNAGALRDRVEGLVASETLVGVEFATGCSWSPMMLVATILFWVWSDSSTLIDRFRQLMELQLSGNFRRHGYALLAVDGSRFEVPRTSSNLQAFAAKENNGKRKRHQKSNRTGADLKKGLTTQIWTTVMWHVGLGLPWDWRRGQRPVPEPTR